MKRNEQNINHRPAKCLHCGSRAVHAHGTTPKTRRVKLLRFRCWDCGKTYNVDPDPITRRLSGLKIKQSFKDIIRDFGLIALGLPDNQIRKLTRRKPDTIHRTLRRCRNEPKLWDAICYSLLTDHRITEVDLDRLELNSKGERPRASAFQSAFGKRIDSFGANKRLLRHRDVLCAQIERLIGNRVAYAASGEFFRADVGVEQIPWIKKIRAADQCQIDEDLLGDLFYSIALQVRFPNQKAQALALRRRTAPVMTLSCLCDGMEIQYGGASAPVTLPEFMDGLKEIVKQLK